MTLLEHLQELRGRLFWIIASVAVAAIAGWVLFDRVIDVILEPARPMLEDLTDGKLIFTGPSEAFLLRLKTALYIGFAIAFPIVLFQIWRFVSPGLHRKERRYAIPFVASGLLLFASGVAVALWTMPRALRILIGPEVTGGSVVPLLSARSYIDFSLMYLAAFGLAFEFPVILMLLGLIRAITWRQMARYRRHVFMGIAVISAALTPPDAFTMIILSAAMYVLYEACIWLLWLFRR